MFGNKEKDLSKKLKGDDAKWFNYFKEIVDSSSELSAEDIKVLKVDNYYTLRLLDIDWVRWNFAGNPKWFQLHIKEENEDNVYSDIINKDSFFCTLRMDDVNDDYANNMEIFFDRMYEIIDTVKYGK